MPEDRLFYGYRLRSDIPLSSLPRLTQPGEPDIVLRRGAVPATIPNPTWTTPFVEVGSDDTILIRASDGLRFFLRGGHDIVVETHADAHAGEVETFLFSIVAGALMHQRGELALHASCVVIGDRAVAIAGPSGRGKSTMAAALVAQGHTFLTDDICRICVIADCAFAIPGPARIRLWPDAVIGLGGAPDALERGRPGHEKRVMPADAVLASAMVPLAAIVRLRVDRRVTEGRLERITGPAAVLPADELIYRVRLGREMGRGVDLFQRLTGLGRIVPVFSLTRADARTEVAHLASLVAGLSHASVGR